MLCSGSLEAFGVGTMASIPLMIDSGAYSAHMKGTFIDIDEYIDFIYEIKEDFPHAVYINLDVIEDGKGSYRNWMVMREQGLEPIPIWHVQTPIKYLKRYLEATNHIGIGAIANMSSARRMEALDRIWDRYLVGPDRMPLYKVHGMGITSFPLMRKYPWYSIDSTSWLQISMYGHILQPRRRDGAWDFGSMPFKIGFSTKCSDQKHKNKHFKTMSPAEQKVLLQYLKEMGFELGTSRYEEATKGVNKGKIVEIPIVKGVSNFHGCRADLNAVFYGEFLRSVPYPRPFARVSKGLGM